MSPSGGPARAGTACARQGAGEGDAARLDPHVARPSSTSRVVRLVHRRGPAHVRVRASGPARRPRPSRPSAGDRCTARTGRAGRRDDIGAAGGRSSPPGERATDRPAGWPPGGIGRGDRSPAPGHGACRILLPALGGPLTSRPEAGEERWGHGVLEAGRSASSACRGLLRQAAFLRRLVRAGSGASCGTCGSRPGGRPCSRAGLGLSVPRACPRSPGLSPGRVRLRPVPSARVSARVVSAHGVDRRVRSRSWRGRSAVSPSPWPGSLVVSRRVRGETTDAADRHVGGVLGCGRRERVQRMSLDS